MNVIGGSKSDKLGKKRRNEGNENEENDGVWGD